MLGEHQGQCQTCQNLAQTTAAGKQAAVPHRPDRRVEGLQVVGSRSLSASQPSPGAVQGDTEELPPPEQQQGFPRHGVRAGSHCVGRGGAWCSSMEGRAGREATALAGAQGQPHSTSPPLHSEATLPMQATGFRLTIFDAIYISLLDNRDRGQLHELGSPSALLHDPEGWTRS